MVLMSTPGFVEKHCLAKHANTSHGGIRVVPKSRQRSIINNLLSFPANLVKAKPIKGKFNPNIHRYAEISNAVYYDTSSRQLSAHKLGLQLDFEFETSNMLLMYDMYTKKAILCFRGTKLPSPSDIQTDIAILMGDELSSSRFKTALLHTMAAISKYGKRKLTVTGHSMGATIGLYCARQSGIRAHLFNPGSAPVTFIKKMWQTLFQHTKDSAQLTETQEEQSARRASKRHQRIYVYIVRGDILSNFILLDDTIGHRIHVFEANEKHNAHYLGNFLRS